MATLAEVGEFALIEEILQIAGRGAPGVRVGIGDDAAVLALGPHVAVSTDTLTEHVHFERQWLRPVALGRRAFRVAVSDLAAMGARPRYALLSLSLPPDMALADARAIVRGFDRDARGESVALVGGNVSRGSEISLTVTVIGVVAERPVLRRGAMPNQPIAVTGTLGGAAAGVDLLAAGRRGGRLAEAYCLPPLRVGVGQELARAGLAAAMIDVSDGLVQDLGHLCRASRVGAEIDLEAVPVAPGLRRVRSGVLRRTPLEYALHGGEDYELLVVLRDEEALAGAIRLCRRHDCKLTRIGKITAREGVAAKGGTLLEGGYDHFGMRA
ncbi:MAG: thiamine-phosphate kinase [Candidatus Dadabacteria bacterium]|nr:MAG: thiamine-phosphate kinase [Candidatus Dadabacteria bacterium]